MSEATDILFDEFAIAYRRGEAPDVLTYLERAGDDANELAALIDAFLQAVPAREATEEELVLMQARLEQEPALLVLRRRRRLTRDAVVGALMSALGLDASKSAKVRGYYSDLEVGVLDPKPVDRRIWDALNTVLNANARVLAGLRPPPPASAMAYRRRLFGSVLHEHASTSPDLPASMDAVGAAADDRDEIDRLFTGSA